MPTVTLRQLAQESKVPYPTLAKLIRQLLTESNDEWDRASTGAYDPHRTIEGNELNAAYHQGRAHMIGEILGDQTDLHWFLDRLEGEPEPTNWMHRCGRCSYVWQDTTEEWERCPSCQSQNTYVPEVPTRHIGYSAGLPGIHVG